MKKTFLPALILFLILIAPYAVVSTQGLEKQPNMVKEDGIIEMSSAICWFLAASFLFYLFIKSKSDNKRYFLRTKKNYFFLLLSLLFIFCSGEEISWGQRIFGIETPQSIQKINIQGEINLHNLSIFHGTNKDNASKKGLERWYTLGRLFSLFCFAYGILVPVLNKLSSKISKVIRTMNLPVVPLWIGAFLLVNYLLSRIFGRTGLIITHAAVEIKELNIAFLFLIASISFLIAYKKDKAITIADA